MELNFESPLFIIDLSTGLIFLALGLIIKKYPAKEINSIYGYRTKLSKKSEENWHFSQWYSNQLMLRYGFMLILFSCSGLFLNYENSISIFTGLIAVILCCISIFLRTEKALKEFEKS